MRGRFPLYRGFEALLKAGLSFQSHHAIWGKEAVRKHLVPSFLAVLQSLLHGAACLMHASQMPFPILSQRSCKSKVEKVHCHGMIGGGRALLCREVVHVFHEPSFHPDGVCSMSLLTKSCNFACYCFCRSRCKRYTVLLL